MTGKAMSLKAKIRNISREKALENIVGISALLAIMTIGIVISKKDSELGKKLSSKYNQLWIVA